MEKVILFASAVALVKPGQMTDILTGEPYPNLFWHNARRQGAVVARNRSGLTARGGHSDCSGQRDNDSSVHSALGRSVLTPLERSMVYLHSSNGLCVHHMLGLRSVHNRADLDQLLEEQP